MPRAAARRPRGRLARAPPRRRAGDGAAAAPLPTNRLVARVGRQGDQVGHEGLAQEISRANGLRRRTAPAQARAAATVSPVVVPIIEAAAGVLRDGRRFGGGGGGRRAAAAAGGAAAAAARARLRAERGRRRGEPARARRAHREARRRGVEHDPQARRLCGGERARGPPEHAGGAQGARQVWDPAGDAAVCRRLGAREAAVRPRRVRARGARRAPPPRRRPRLSRRLRRPHFLYYWDDRDGDDWAGWWLTPHAIGDDRYVLHGAERTLLPHREGWRANAKIVDAHGGAQPDVAVRCIFRLPSGSWLAEPIIMVTGTAATALDGVDFSSASSSATATTTAGPPTAPCRSPRRRRTSASTTSAPPTPRASRRRRRRNSATGSRSGRGRASRRRAGRCGGGGGAGVLPAAPVRGPRSLCTQIRRRKCIPSAVHSWVSPARSPRRGGVGGDPLSSGDRPGRAAQHCRLPHRAMIAVLSASRGLELPNATRRAALRAVTFVAADHAAARADGQPSSATAAPWSSRRSAIRPPRRGRRRRELGLWAEIPDRTACRSAASPT